MKDSELKNFWSQPDLKWLPSLMMNLRKNRNGCSSVDFSDIELKVVVVAESFLPNTL